MTDDLRYRTVEWLVDQLSIVDDEDSLWDQILNEICERAKFLDTLRYCDFADTTDGKEAHFFLSNATDWVTDTNLPRAIGRLARQSQYTSRHFHVWYVPLPPDAHYKIRDYAPQVEDKRFIGSFDSKPKSKKR